FPAPSAYKLQRDRTTDCLASPEDTAILPDAGNRGNRNACVLVKGPWLAGKAYALRCERSSYLSACRNSCGPVVATQSDERPCTGGTLCPPPVGGDATISGGAKCFFCSVRSL